MTDDNNPNQGGINAEAGRDLSVGRDLTGRDKFENRITVEAGGALHLYQGGAAPSSQAPTPTPPASPSPNPFFAGGRITDAALFFGRERLVREVRSDLKNRNSVSLVGDSELGKSSLLTYLHLTRHEWLPDVPVHYVDLQGVLDEADFCLTVLRQFGQTGETLRDLKRALEGRAVVLLFDEMERIAEQDFNPRLRDLLRSRAQELPHCALCVATRRPLADVFVPRGPLSEFHNIFTPRHLGPFTLEEANNFLASRLAPTGVACSPAEMEDLLARSRFENGIHPARLQRAARAWFEKKVAADK
jgi:hypothetical protein